MKISTKGRYALTIMLDLAKNYKSDRYITLKEISESENISLKYLEKIMLSLKTKDYFISSVGASGGYKLKYEPSKYIIADILEAAEGNIDVTDCVKEKHICPKHHKCNTYKLWDELNTTIKNFLNSKTLEDYIGDNYE